MGFVFLIGAVVGALLVYAWLNYRALHGRRAAVRPAPPRAEPAGALGYGNEFLDRAYALQARLFQQSMPSLPHHILEMPAFADLVEALSDPRVTNEALFDLVMGQDAGLSWGAMAVLAARPRDEALEARLLATLNAFNAPTRFFELHLLEAWNPADPSLAGRVLLCLDPTWDHPAVGPVLDGFVRRRAKVGIPSLEGLERPEGFDGGLLRHLLKRWVDSAHARLLLEELGEGPEPGPRPGPPGFRPPFPGFWGAPGESLADVGRVTPPGGAKAESVLAYPTADAQLERLLGTLTRSGRRSVLVVGEPGVGKTSLVRRAAARLSQDGWTIFEATASELNAGMSFVGTLEARLSSVIEFLARGRKTLWIVRDFHQLLWTGRAMQNPTGALERIMPALEARRIRILGETRPAALERVLVECPEVERLFDVIRLDPPSAAELDGMLEAWGAWVAQRSSVGVPPAVRTEAAELARQYLPSQPPPGGVLRLLGGALVRAKGRVGVGGAAAMLTMDDLLATLAELTGLPHDILDERCELDLEAVRRRFESRVIGQPEAVGCLVERLAMLKAGVTDPNRPTGVFLFAGGSGTGKTELARTLADYLFGSPERLVRLDMSEMQDPRSLDRLLGEANGLLPSGNSLVERVRRQPFSIVLLDEFERAHPEVWDVFLQVFDAGRLTDRQGETADFRHTIIVLTSNLGAASGEARLGLTGGAEDASPAGIRRAVERTFRPEFLNRLDRVVVFRPLTREVMRQILRKELTDAFARRGLRRRDWAVEMEESAFDLLVEQGFSPAHGARPLRRALERLLLTPLAAAIVNRSAPEGNQFLFVRADGDRLAVEFVDPDAPAAPAAAAAAGAGVATLLRVPASAERDLAAILYEAHGTADEVEVLRVALLELEGRVQDEAWTSTKQALLLEGAAPGFWERPDRFERLGRAEYMDRIESALRSAGSLLERMQRSAHPPRSAYPRDMVRRLAQQLYLVDAACGEATETGPRDAFVSVEPSHEDVTPAGATRDFARRVAGMYEAWARARGMRFADLGQAEPDGESRLFAISGFAAYRLLAPEAGLHVHEWDEPGSKAARRATVRVRVEPQPAAPARDGIAGLRHQADEALGTRAPLPTTVVRRYREAPAPLVKDLVRGWRTGRIERVLGGDFDVIPVRD